MSTSPCLSPSPHDSASRTTPYRRSRVAAVLLVALASVASGACGQQPEPVTPFATFIGSPLADGSGDVARAVRYRGADSAILRRGDALLRGDRVRVDGTGRYGVLLRLRDGHEAILAPGARVTLRNPSIFAEVGKMLMAAVDEVRDALKAEGQHVTAAVPSTELYFQVDPGDVIVIAVREGTVELSSNDSIEGRPAWPPLLIDSLQATRVVARRPPESPRPISAEAFDALTPWAGPRSFVPYVIGRPADEAQRILERAGFRASRSGPPEPAGFVVVDQNPRGGVRRAVRSEVIISAVPDSAQSRCTVPDLRGLGARAALQRMRDARMTSSRIPQRTDRFQIVSQAPAAGSVVPCATRLVVRFRTGR